MDWTVEKKLCCEGDETWSRLPRETVDVILPEVFKVRLDGALSNLGQWKLSLLMAGGLERDDA